LTGSFLAAVRLLTVLPLGRKAPTAVELGGAAMFFPLVGALLGVALAGLDLLLADRPELLRGALLLLAWVTATGALHLDGLADTFDGLSGMTPERRLAIMADATTGAYGVVGVAGLLMLKFAALASLEPQALPAALIAAPLLGRWAMTLVITVFPYARGPGGLGYRLKRGAGVPGLVAATVFSLALVFVLLRWQQAVFLAAVIPLALGLGWWLTRRLGGLTGDTYGMTCELVETAVLVIAVFAWEVS
jgi:adenosylcobinamide-GDP ribazoletransferase